MSGRAAVSAAMILVRHGVRVPTARSAVRPGRWNGEQHCSKGNRTTKNQTSFHACLLNMVEGACLLFSSLVAMRGQKVTDPSKEASLLGNTGSPFRGRFAIARDTARLGAPGVGQ